MAGVRLGPAQSLLDEFSRAELERLASKQRLGLGLDQSKRRLISGITRHLDIDEIAGALLEFFPKRRPSVRKPRHELRLDRAQRLSGPTTVQVYSRARPSLGRVLLKNAGSCVQLRLNNVQLFLENRWPVVGRDGGLVPTKHLYAAFVGARRIHSSAEMPPPKDRPFILDEGDYGLHGGRLRLELLRSGLLSFRVQFLRYQPRSGRPEYLLGPIA